MFTLPFQIPEAPHKIKLKDSIFSIGSCFSDNIGDKLTAHKFDVVTNPLGILYNPFSIFKNLRLLLSEGLDPDNFIEAGGVYFHWDTHSDISGTAMDSFKALLEARSHTSRQSLTSANWLIITLGTIYVYKHLESGKIVANCHKIPQRHFQKLSLSQAEIEEDFFQTMELLRTINPDIKVILTVSPVRHIRDGLIENNVSKATLLQTVNNIVKNDPNIYYFPAYEILIDELRDYRFFKEDMIHPTEQAIQYIWERFITACLDPDAIGFISEWAKVKKSLEHRPFHPDTNEHQRFLRSTLTKLEALSQRVDVSGEMELIKNQLIR